MANAPVRRRVARQQEFEFKSWGGKRKGAGRKPKGTRAGVSHRQRAALTSPLPVHVTMRLRPGLASLRKAPTRRALEQVFGAACERFDTRIVHYSIQSNHLHLIVESEERHALSRALQGLAIRIARTLNRLWGRKGKVFADRYHDRILRTPREVRNALVYVLKNHVKHGVRLVGIDPFASGSWFEGWEDAPGIVERALHLASAKSWLSRTGWRKGGLIGLAEAPRSVG